VVLKGVLDGIDQDESAIVPFGSGDLTFHDGWEIIGQFLTECGGAILDGVRTPWSSAAGYVDEVFQPCVYNTLNVRAGPR
jgi:hypothetical protein